MVMWCSYLGRLVFCCSDYILSGPKRGLGVRYCCCACDMIVFFTPILDGAKLCFVVRMPFGFIAIRSSPMRSLFEVGPSITPSNAWSCLRTMSMLGLCAFSRVAICDRLVRETCVIEDWFVVAAVPMAAVPFAVAPTFKLCFIRGRGRGLTACP